MNLTHTIRHSGCSISIVATVSLTLQYASEYFNFFSLEPQTNPLVSSKELVDSSNYYFVILLKVHLLIVESVNGIHLPDCKVHGVYKEEIGRFQKSTYHKVLVLKRNPDVIKERQTGDV